MEQARQHPPETTSPRFEALVAEIVPKLRRLGPQLSEQTLRQTAERLAAHRLASERPAELAAAGNAVAPSYPSFPVYEDSAHSPLDDANVRHLAVSLAHRMRPVSQHLTEGELVSLATRMAVLETTASSSRVGGGTGMITSLSTAAPTPIDNGSPTPRWSTGDDTGRTHDYDSTTVTAMAERYASAEAALTTFPWLGLFSGAGIGYVAGLVVSHALGMRVDLEVTTTIVLVLFCATVGLMIGRVKGNLESHRLREEARATLAAADRKRLTEGDKA